MSKAPNTNIWNETNKTFIVRVNYDLPDLDSLNRIHDSLSTIDTLLENGNKVILLTHWGRPVAKDPEFSTEKLVDVIEESLAETVIFLDQFEFGFAKVTKEIKHLSARVFLLQNTRFEPSEQSKDMATRLELAREYAALGDFFIDEAFAVSHRTEATNTEIKELMDWDYGIAFQNEVENLTKLKSNPKKPFMVVMGGSKLETKLELIEKMCETADQILLGGMLCFTFIAAKNTLLNTTNNPSTDSLEIYDSFVDSAFLLMATELLNKYPDKIVLPMDLVYLEECTKKTAVDIGPRTIELYSGILESSKTIFWNGPMGYYEKKPFDKGTIAIGEIIAKLANDKKCFGVVGGGDTVAAISEFNLEKFDFVSMGGGATLEFLAKK